MEAIVWQAHGDVGAGQPETLDNFDLSHVAVAEITGDVQHWIAAHEDLIASTLEAFPWYDAAQVGHDFALTRNHHGAGFWDRGLGDHGDALTTAAEAEGSADVWLNAANELEYEV